MGAFLSLLAAAAQQPSAPIIVKLVEPPHDPTGIAAVLVGAIGLSGVLALGALVLGVLVGLVLFVARSRQPLQ